MRRSRISIGLLYGVLSMAGIVGVATLVWAAIPRGAPVTYTATDIATMPAGTTFTAQTLNALGPFTASGNLTASGAVFLSGALSPAQITTTPQHNYSPAGLATATSLRLDCNPACTISGLATGAAGRFLPVHNVGTQNITLPAESASSTAANRFDFPGDLTLIPKAAFVLQYDATAPNPRWRTSFAGLVSGPVSASLLNLSHQASDCSPPAGGILSLYQTSNVLKTRDSAGNVVTVGAGGGGASTSEKLPVVAATTANITIFNPGTAVFDGVTLAEWPAAADLAARYPESKWDLFVHRVRLRAAARE